MTLKELYITDEIRCKFHDGLNIILGVNHSTPDLPSNLVHDTGKLEADKATTGPLSNPGDIATEPRQEEEVSSSGEKVSDTNGVGKTLLVSIIKHVLGGDTETTFESPHFTQKKFWGVLSLDIGGGPLTVSRPLWRPLAEDLYLIADCTLDEFINYLLEAKIKLEEVTSQRELADQLESVNSPLKPLSKKEYQRHIAKLENIDYSKSNITLSSLLDFMIRDEKVGFSDPISRIRRAQWGQYRSAQYLFGLPASTEGTCSKLQEEISNLQITLKTLRGRLHDRGITSEDKIENLKLSATSKLKKIREDIEEVRVIPSLEKARQDYQNIRTEFTTIASALNKKEHYLRGYTKNREDLRDKAKSMTELLKVSEFYADLLQFFPKQIEENISDFQSFFDDLSNDRERYYADLIVGIKADIKFLQSERDRLAPILDSLAQQFKNSSVLRDISTLAAAEERIQGEIKELDDCRSHLLECEAVDEKIAELEELRRSTLVEGKTQDKKFKDRRKGLINLFHELVADIYGSDDGELAFEYNSNGASSTAGRTEITCSISSQNSHGRTYAKINIFDFIWFLGEKRNGEFKPGFLIHDGSYSKISRDVKVKMLKAVVPRLAGQQYFITVNEGELDMMSEWSKWVCCRLDGSTVGGKFFREQFD